METNLLKNNLFLACVFVWLSLLWGFPPESDKWFIQEVTSDKAVQPGGGTGKGRVHKRCVISKFALGAGAQSCWNSGSQHRAHASELYPLRG